jgi:recombination protein RecT
LSNNQLAKIKSGTIDVVEKKVRQFQDEGDLHFPSNYSPQNALKSAWLTIQSTLDKNKKPALEVCTRDSVANALLSMVVQGLNPDKKQGYFIVYGNSLVFQRSYFGTMAVTKRVVGAKEIDAAVIYDGDEVDYEMKNGRIVDLTHKQKFGNINKEKIIGAYATIVIDKENVYHELMTIDEIRQAWSKAQFWSKDAKVEKKGSTHDEFKQEMAKKTVINRACKKFFNSSDDSSLVIDHFNKQDENIEQAQAQQEINENANKEFIDVEYEEVKDQQTQQEPAQQQDIPPQQEQSNDYIYDSFEQSQATGTDGPKF